MKMIAEKNTHQASSVLTVRTVLRSEIAVAYKGYLFFLSLGLTLTPAHAALNITFP